MSRAIVISQSLRFPQAEILAATMEQQPIYIVTGEGLASDAAFGEGVSLVPLPTSTAQQTRVQSAVESVRRSLRKDSPIAHRALKWLRSADWRLRHIDRLGRALSRRASGPVEPDMRVMEALEAVHATDPLESVVVMDLFDLHAVLEFASRTGVPVTVR